MTYQRFKQLWLSILGKDVTFKCSCHTAKALNKVADGDHSEFDKIGEMLDRRDRETKILDEKSEVLPGLSKTATPREARKYFRDRFGKFVSDK